MVCLHPVSPSSSSRLTSGCDLRGRGRAMATTGRACSPQAFRLRPGCPLDSALLGSHSVPPGFPPSPGRQGRSHSALSGHPHSLHLGSSAWFSQGLWSPQATPSCPPGPARTRVQSLPPPGREAQDPIPPPEAGATTALQTAPGHSSPPHPGGHPAALPPAGPLAVALVRVCVQCVS